MANPNPPLENLKPFKPGQSGNPGGKTSEQRRLEVENAERATRIRNAMLASIEGKLGDGVDAAELIEATMLKLLKDSEDRGLGTPTQSVDHTTGGQPMQPVAGFDVRIVDASAGDADPPAG